MNIGLKDAIYLILFVAGIISTFFTTKYKLKEYTDNKVDALKDKFDELKQTVNNQSLEIERLRSKDDVQQANIDIIEKQLQSTLTQLFSMLQNKK